jgi:hypothetical protein
MVGNFGNNPADRRSELRHSSSKSRVCRLAGHQADDGLLSKATFNAFVIGCTFIRADKPGCD